jgi:hypothetical protein
MCECPAIGFLNRAETSKVAFGGNLNNFSFFSLSLSFSLFAFVCRRGSA